MKPKYRVFRSSIFPSHIALSVGLALAGAGVQSALAASQTWLNTGSNANWSDAANWVGSVAPGDTSVLTNTDVATFGTAVGSVGVVGNPIVIDSATQNLGGISFGAAAGNYYIGSIGGNSLLLSSGGSIQLLSSLTATNAMETVNAPLVVEGAAGSYTISNNSASGSISASSVLALGGGTLSYTRTGSTTQTFASTNVNAGTSAILVVAGDTLALGALTQAVGGTVDLSTTGPTTTTTTNTNGILGG